jgi:hypothetical protein
MKYVLIRNWGDYVIHNDEANFLIGKVRSADGHGNGPFRVSACVTPAYCGPVEVATVNSLHECVEVLADYYDKNPPRWTRRRAGLYEKKTIFSALRVEQDQRRRWRTYRDDFPMLEDCRPASFSTCAEAQRAADVHQLDNYPDASAIEDALSWDLDPEINWRSLPDFLEARARREILASL